MIVVIFVLLVNFRQRNVFPQSIPVNSNTNLSFMLHKLDSFLCFPFHRFHKLTQKLFLDDRCLLQVQQFYELSCGGTVDQQCQKHGERSVEHDHVTGALVHI